MTEPGKASTRIWRGPEGAPSLYLYAPGRADGDWDAFGRLLKDAFTSIRLESLAATATRSAGAASALITHGQACLAALQLAAEPGSGIGSLVLADPPAAALHARRLPDCPVLILRGRQSTLLSHEKAVGLKESFPAARLIEPEDCGTWPFGSCPEAAAAAVRTFLADLDSEDSRFFE